MDEAERLRSFERAEHDRAAERYAEFFAHVTALDGEPIAQQIADTLPAHRFTYAISRFEDFAFPPAEYDLLNAQYALPFIRPDQFDRVLAALLASLKPGALFTGQLFGNRDDWAGTPTLTFHTRAAAEALRAPLTLLSFREEDDPNGQTLNGKAKHWHLFHFLARRD